MYGTYNVNHSKILIEFLNIAQDEVKLHFAYAYQDSMENRLENVIA